MPIVPSHLSKEEREVEECTFRPRINETCPFISDRTLRRYAQLQRPSSDEQSDEIPIKHAKTSKRKPANLQAGNYKKSQGFLRGPPEYVGMPLFYFDALNPPNFTMGLYGGTVVKGKAGGGGSSSEEDDESEEEVEVTDDGEDDDEDEAAAEGGSRAQSDKKVLACPPLPPWANGLVAVSSAAAAPKNRIVINRIDKGEKKEEEASGWQAVLAEMQRRANKSGTTLKSPEPVRKEAPQPQKKNKKKKKGEFKDVMEELNYKLAVARGEIIEEPDSDEESIKSKASKSTVDTKAEVKPEVKPEVKVEEKTAAKLEEKPPSLVVPTEKVEEGGKPAASDALKALFAGKAAPKEVPTAVATDDKAVKAPGASDALKTLFAGKAKDAEPATESKAPAASDALKALFAGKTKDVAGSKDEGDAEAKKAPGASDALKALFAGKTKDAGAVEKKEPPPAIDTNLADPQSANTTPTPGSVYKLNSRPDLNALLNKAKVQNPAKPPDTPGADSETKGKAAAALNKLFKSPGAPEKTIEQAPVAKVEEKPSAPAPAAKEAVPVLAAVPAVVPAPKAAVVKVVAAPPAVSFTPSVAGNPGSDISVKRPAKVPLGPPLPSAWPPIPYISLVKPSAPSSSSASAPPLASPMTELRRKATSSGEKKKKTKIIKKKKKKPKKDKKDKKDKKSSSSSGSGQVVVGGKTLPEGYYIAAPQPEVVKDKIILSAGEITDDMRNKLIQQFTLLKQHEDSKESKTGDGKKNKKSDIEDISKKLSVSDLPVPSSYAATIERMKKAQQIRDEAKAKEKSLQLRNYDEDDDYVETTKTPKVSKVNPIVSQSGALVSINDTKITVADDVVFTTDKHYGNKSFTFRKEMTSSESDQHYHSIYETVADKELSRGNAALVNSYHRANQQAGMDRGNALWLNSLRSEPTAGPSTPGRMSRGANPSTPSKNDLSNSLFAPSSSSKLTKSVVKTPGDNSLYNSVNNMKVAQSITKAKAPLLKSDEVMEKRKNIREMQQQLEKEHLEKMKQLEKMKKEKLKQQAMATAASQGAYKPHERHRSHAKILQKYANNSEVIGGLDLVKVTDKAYTEYKFGNHSSENWRTSDSMSVMSGGSSVQSSHYSINSNASSQFHGNHPSAYYATNAQHSNPQEYQNESDEEELYSQYGEEDYQNTQPSKQQGYRTQGQNQNQMPNANYYQQQPQSNHPSQQYQQQPQHQQPQVQQAQPQAQYPPQQFQQQYIQPPMPQTAAQVPSNRQPSQYQTAPPQPPQQVQQPIYNPPSNPKYNARAAQLNYNLNAYASPPAVYTQASNNVNKRGRMDMQELSAQKYH